MLLTDREAGALDAGPGCAIMAIGFCLVLTSPGMLVVRNLFPLLDGWSWYLTALLISVLILVWLCRAFGAAAGLVSYVLLAAGSTWHQVTTEPVTYLVHQAETRGAADARAGVVFDHRYMYVGNTRCPEAYGEAYRRTVLARQNKRVKWTDYKVPPTAERTGEIVDFTITHSERDEGWGSDRKRQHMFEGCYHVRSPDGTVHKTESVTFLE